MAAGFESFNELDKLQFSSTYQNYGLLSKGTFTLTKELWGWNDGLTTGVWNEANSSGVPVSGAPALPLLYTNAYLDEFPGVSGDIIAFFSTSPIVTTATVVDDGLGNTSVFWRLISSTNGASVDVYSFLQMEKFQSTLPAHGAGLELYDENSKLTYSSEYKPLRYVTSYTIGTGGSTSGSTVPAGKKYALSIATNVITQTINNGGATVQTFPRIIFPSPVNPRIYPRPNGTFLGARYTATSGGSIALSNLVGAGFTNGSVATGRLDVFDVTDY